MSNSTKVELFKKPRADFPLYPHRDKKRGTARWAEKVRRTRYYFGNCEGDEDGQKALAEWLRTKDDLLAGRKRRPKDDDSLTVAGLCNHFLTAKHRQLASGELSYRTRADYGAIGNRIVGAFGKSRRVEDLTADDFDKLRADVAKIGGPHHVGNVVQRVRTVYKSAFEAGLIDRPVRHGPTFKKPSRGTMRLALPGVHTLRNLRKRLKQVDRLTGRSSERDRDTQRKREWRAASKEVQIPACEDPERRTLLESDDTEWLRYYFHELFWYPFTTQQLEMIEAIRNANLYGGDQSLAASRGEGKTKNFERMRAD